MTTKLVCATCNVEVGQCEHLLGLQITARCARCDKLEIVREEAAVAVSWCPDCHGVGRVEPPLRGGDFEAKSCVRCGALRAALAVMYDDGADAGFQHGSLTRASECRPICDRCRATVAEANRDDGALLIADLEKRVAKLEAVREAAELLVQKWDSGGGGGSHAELRDALDAAREP